MVGAVGPRKTQGEGAHGKGLLRGFARIVRGIASGFFRRSGIACPKGQERLLVCLLHFAPRTEDVGEIAVDEEPPQAAVADAEGFRQHRTGYAVALVQEPDVLLPEILRHFLKFLPGHGSAKLIRCHFSVPPFPFRLRHVVGGQRHMLRFAAPAAVVSAPAGGFLFPHIRQENPSDIFFVCIHFLSPI